MITVNLNGESKELPGEIPVAEALQLWGYSGTEIAVAVNGEFVPRSRYAERPLCTADCIDIVAPIQGG